VIKIWAKLKSCISKSFQFPIRLCVQTSVLDPFLQYDCSMYDSYIKKDSCAAAWFQLKWGFKLLLPFCFKVLKFSRNLDLSEFDKSTITDIEFS